MSNYYRKHAKEEEARKKKQLVQWPEIKERK
jgi:hypothetical protein